MKKSSILKRTFAMVMSIPLAVLCVANASAETTNSNKIIYQSDSGYEAVKISHPNNDVEMSDGIVDYTGGGTLGTNLEDGKGDRGQNYTWGSIGYGDYMYIGTCYNSWLNTLSSMKNVLGHNYDENIMMDALEEMYHGDFCTGQEDGVDSDGILLKINVKTGEVKILMSKATTSTNCLFRNAVEFKGKLYFCGSVNSVPCIYQVNPETDECKQVYVGMTIDEYIGKT